MTIPPPQPARAGRGRHASAGPRPTLGITRIEHRSDMPDGVNALATLDGTTIIVRAGLDSGTRRRAVREVLAATHRFPSLVLIPVLVDARIRRLVFQAGDTASGVVQHVTTLAAPASPVTAVVASVAVLAAGAGVGVATGVIGSSGPAGQHRRSGAPASQPVSPSGPVHAHLRPTPDYYLGVYERTSPSSYAGVLRFGDTVGRMPNLALYYSGWGEPFRVSFAAAALGHGATPVIQINPDGGTSLAGVASGRYDAYLRRYAAQVHAYGKNVVIGFGHEMNGNWYQWGWGHTSPAVFVRAWRHVVSVFRAAGDDNVTWLWTINGDAAGVTGPIADWWPGSGYVTWVGIDGYYLTGPETFAQVFGPTVAAVHRVAPGKPILIAETAAGPPEASEAEQITGLFQGIRQRSILGFIWFDEPGKSGRPWRLEGNPAATEAFRRAVRGYG